MEGEWRARLVVVGDWPENRKLIEHALDGCAITFANLPFADTVITSAENSPDLLIIHFGESEDASMQLELCRSLRASSATIMLPIVAVGASHRHQSAALAAGVDQFLPLDIRAKEFRAIVAALT